MSTSGFQSMVQFCQSMMIEKILENQADVDESNSESKLHVTLL